MANTYNDADYVITVAGRKVCVAPRFAKGHRLSEVEAEVLNRAIMTNASKSLESAYERGKRGEGKDETEKRADMAHYLNTEYQPDAPKTQTVADLRAKVAKDVLGDLLSAGGKPRPDDASLEKTVPKFLTMAYGGERPDLAEKVDAALDALMSKIEPKTERQSRTAAAEVDLGAL